MFHFRNTASSAPLVPLLVPAFEMTRSFSSSRHASAASVTNSGSGGGPTRVFNPSHTTAVPSMPSFSATVHTRSLSFPNHGEASSCYAKCCPSTQDLHIFCRRHSQKFSGYLVSSFLRVSSDKLQCFPVLAPLVLSELKVLSLAASIQKENPCLCSPAISELSGEGTEEWRPLLNFSESSQA